MAMPFGTATIVTTTIPDVIYARLRAAIIQGVLRPGERLVETKLAEEFNVSRTPLREALKRLEQERFVLRIPQGGVTVAQLSAAEARELNEIRSVLEGLAARNAAKRYRLGLLTPEDTKIETNLRVEIQMMEERLRLGDIDALLEAGKRFHKGLHLLSGNTRSLPIIDQIMAGMERYRALVPPTRHLETIAEHRSIFEFIIEGSETSAEEAMRSHIDDAGDLYIKALSSSTDASEVLEERGDIE